jgi:ketopantoate reductase
MTGAVVELADRLGIAVPHIRTLYACAKLLDATLAAQRAQ